MRRQIIALIAAVLLLCCTSLPVFATPDDFESGTVSLTTTPDGKVTIYRVGDIAEDDGNYSFVLTGGYAESGLSLSDIQSPELAEKLAEIAKNDKSGETRTADKDGKVTFDVAKGLYLLVQTKAGKDGLFSPFLISMPNYEDGAYTDKVDATPKVSIEKVEEPSKPDKNTDTKLPQTGQLNWPVPVLAFSGLLLFIVGIGLRRGKEKQ